MYLQIKLWRSSLKSKSSVICLCHIYGAVKTSSKLVELRLHNIWLWGLVQICEIMHACHFDVISSPPSPLSKTSWWTEGFNEKHIANTSRQFCAHAFKPPLSWYIGITVQVTWLFINILAWLQSFCNRMLLTNMCCLLKLYDSTCLCRVMHGFLSLHMLCMQMLDSPQNL